MKFKKTYIGLCWKYFREFAIRKNENALTTISEIDYKKTFETLSKEQLQKAYDTAWDAKRFESDAYWKRANYFWAFQVASFAGYYSVLSSGYFKNNPEILYYVISIGFVTSLAWLFINIGGKIWQRHWEIHIDLLEENITGPLYKIVTTSKTFSVSKINEIISGFFTVIWFIIGINYLVKNFSFDYKNIENVNFSLVICTMAVIYFSMAMIFGYGRGRFGKRKVKLYKRDYEVSSHKII
ncbi:MAG: hypothetical protein IPP71_19820 [Bacteroidetes bacterium]|nr:hypothetical protein [Bacteroidota bacterium]